VRKNLHMVFLIVGIYISPQFWTFYSIKLVSSSIRYICYITVLTGQLLLINVYLPCVPSVDLQHDEAILVET